MTPRSLPTPEALHLVTQLAQRADDVELGLPLHLGDVDALHVVRGDQRFVHQSQQAQLLHRATRCRPLRTKRMSWLVRTIPKSSMVCAAERVRRSRSSAARSIMSSSTRSIVYRCSPVSSATLRRSCGRALRRKLDRARIGGVGLLGGEHEPQRGVVLAQAVEPVARALLAVVLAQRLAQRAQRIDDAPRDDGRPRVRQLVHQLVDVLELPERGPAGVAPPPARVGRQPDGERLGEVLVRVALGVVRLEMEHVALAVRLRGVVLRVRLRRLAEELLAPAAAPQAVGVLDRVAGLVAQDAHAPFRRAALDLAHLAALQLRQPRDGRGRRGWRCRARRRACTTRPTARSAGGSQVPALELAIELLDARHHR